MIKIESLETDDSNFVEIVEKISNEVIHDVNPKSIYLFRIDNWFDKKWLNFTGKVLGALGTWHYNSETRIPPFNPNRIKNEKYFERNNIGDYQEAKMKMKIHLKQDSENNRDRKIKFYSSSGVFIWFSSNTKKNEHGSVMIYPVNQRVCDPFYVGLKKGEEWRIVHAPGSNKKQIEFYLNRKVAL